MCARPLRVEYSGAFYHVMNRGNAYSDIFNGDQDNQSFFELLKEAVEQWKIRIHAFCLMSNHYHMLIETPRGNLSRAMRHINGVYTQRYNRRWKRDGHIFRGRYKAILVEDEAYLVELLRYIHLNPVEAGLVKKPEAYKWSSHSRYLGKGDLEWLTTGLLLSYFGKQKNRARRKLNEFILEGVPEKLKELLSRKKWPSVFGTENFQEWVEWNFVKDQEEKDIIYEPPEDRVLKAQEIKRIITDVTGMRWKEIGEAKGYKMKWLRRLAIKALSEYSLCTRAEIVRLMGGIDVATVSRAAWDKAVYDDPMWEIISQQIHFALCKT